MPHDQHEQFYKEYDRHNAAITKPLILDNRPVAERVDELEKRLDELDTHRRACTESYTALATFHKELESRIDKLEKLVENFQHAVCENLEKNYERDTKLESRIESLEQDGIEKTVVK